MFAELHALSNFSFLRGASHPGELVAEAARLGYAALALTDECSLAGAVRAHAEAKTLGFKLIIGSEFRLEGGPKLVLLATDRCGYGQLAAFITLGRRAAEKGEYRLLRGQLETHALDRCLAIWLPEDASDAETGGWLARLFPARCWIGVELFLSGEDGRRLSTLQALGERLGLPLVACNDVHMHVRERQPLQDTLTAIRLGKPLAELGYALFPNGERHLRPVETLARLYPRALLEESLRIAERCRFSLDELRYEYPAELVPDGCTAIAWLRELTRQGMARRWPEGAPDKVRRQIEHELELIGAMAYEPFFLTVHDVVQFARSRGILCQGRGSAANSAVCYCLGITEVDPARLDLLFERFISKERNEPPDIDVDFEHERREEVIQYIYRKYGRHRAALAASLITYRTRSAVRDVARALGFSPSRIDALARVLDRHGVAATLPERLAEAGLAPESPAVRRLLALVQVLVGFPRHLSQHVGGFVIAAEDLSHWVPVENAAMPERTVIQWDKDDLESLGLLKVDVLSLGMLTAIRKALAYVGEGRGRPFALADIPPEDPAVYEMLQRADSIGVFQVESRAQMSMLPRLRPNSYYDLVIQIAIVRPGPIQGDMVHPYLSRRAGLEPVSYPSPEVEKVLKRTLGVPIFQEQVMQLAMVAAGFTPGEADQLRRAMAAWHRKGGLEPFEKKLMDGMRERGYEERFARQIYRQIQGFGEYGFPESHSASFALLAYVSAWLKCHHPAAFACALLNSQPMGFYGPSQLIQDARRHGVEVRPIDVNHSDWDGTLEPADSPVPALRLGLRLVNGFSSAAAQRLSEARRQGPFQSVQDLTTRARLDRRELETLAAADALRGLGGHRHRAFWEAAGVEAPTPLHAEPQFTEAEPLLRKPGEAEDVIADYAAAGASLRRHPLSLLRERLDRHGFRTAEALWQVRNGAIARVAGLVVCRQRPMTANGTTFVTIEDETGQINLIVWPATAQAQRRPLLYAQLLAVSGTVQQEEGVLHLVAGRLEDIGKWLDGLVVKSRDFQ
ncbi:error-prone DNA polymerase [Methylococcus geothermalis]|uniref:Error-prone DNA polymerase n=1 Tax=Methylococcus geothermalis TaxID=2681310 RepID=A0A858Q726_9GAMM|nr:error-prone DNA polymerase [Methylococcus geothermalis]QJD29658.1 DNA polymerase III subunit alpha [Methylococcus geothermalis]